MKNGKPWGFGRRFDRFFDVFDVNIHIKDTNGMII